MSTILIVILVILLISALPTWGYSRGWGYYPSGGLGLVLLILLVLLLMGRILTSARIVKGHRRGWPSTAWTDRLVFRPQPMRPSCWYIVVGILG